MKNTFKKTCLHCQRVYNHEKATSKYCSVPCVRKHQKVLNKIRRKEMRKKMCGIKIDKEGFYVSKKETYQSAIIDYPSSPTGKAYIGIAKKPLMPNDNGIGFKGVIIQDDSRQFIQCAGCGEWRKKLQDTHFKKCSKLTQEQYKVKFDILDGQSLVADETSLRYAESANKNREAIELFKRNQAKNSAKSIKSTKNKRRNRFKEIKDTVQWQNRFGTCEEQLKSRLKEFILINKELPSSWNRGQALYKALVSRFGNCSKGLKHYGLPYRERVGTNLKFTFPDFTVYSYNLNKIYDRDALFSMMLSKCKLLTQQIS